MLTWTASEEAEQLLARLCEIVATAPVHPLESWNHPTVELISTDWARDACRKLLQASVADGLCGCPLCCG